MIFTAASLHGIISIAPSNVISGSVTENLQLCGSVTPCNASSDNDAAPLQYQILRVSVSTTSDPFRDFKIPKWTPAEYVLTIIYLGMLDFLSSPFLIYLSGRDRHTLLGEGGTQRRSRRPKEITAKAAAGQSRGRGDGFARGDFHQGKLT